MTTQPDIYTVEARRRLAEAYKAVGMSYSAVDISNGWAYGESIATLAATLRELNWQPPVDPDELEAWEIYHNDNALMHNYELRRDSNIYCRVLAAIKRGRELERGA